MNPLRGGGIALPPPTLGHVAHTHAHAALDAFKTALISHRRPRTCAALSGSYVSTDKERAWCGLSQSAWGLAGLPASAELLIQSDFRVKASINLASLLWAEQQHCVSPQLHFTTLGFFSFLEHCYKGWFCTCCKGWTRLKPPAYLVIWLPFTHLVQWRMKIQNIVPVKQKEFSCGLSTPRTHPRAETVKKLHSSIFQGKSFFFLGKDYPNVFSFCASL